MSQGKLIRIALVGLPIGLFVLGFISMFLHHIKPDIPAYDENFAKRMQAASLNQRDINQADLKRYVSVLADDIGERHYQNPDSLRRAEIYIQSTLKGTSLGYQLNKQMIPIGDQEFHNVSAELTGKKKHQEIIVVGAHYDTPKNSNGQNDNSTGVAALLAIARSLAGEPQDRTIRFVFFVNGCTPEGEEESRGSWIYARKLSAESQKVIAMVNVDSIGHFSDAENSQTWPDGLRHSYPTTGNFIALCGNDESRLWLSNLKVGFSRSAKSVQTQVIPPEPAISATDSDQRSFWNFQFPAILVTDTGALRQPEGSQIDYTKLEQSCRALETAIRFWANP